MALSTVIPASEPEPDDISAQRQPGPLLVEGKGLGLELAERTILEQIDIGVYAGEIVTLIGPNGAGKTSLARLLLE